MGLCWSAGDMLFFISTPSRKKSSTKLSSVVVLPVPGGPSIIVFILYDPLTICLDPLLKSKVCFLCVYKELQIYHDVFYVSKYLVQNL